MPRPIVFTPIQTPQTRKETLQTRQYSPDWDTEPEDREVSKNQPANSRSAASGLEEYDLERADAILEDLEAPTTSPEPVAPSAESGDDPFDSADEDIARILGRKPKTKPTTTPTPKPKSNPPDPIRRSRTASPKEPKQAKLDEDDKILILKFCVEDSELWPCVARKTFWKQIRDKLKEETGIDHTSLGRTVSDLVKRRKEYLAGVSTGEIQEPETEYTIAIDSWIEVLDEEAEDLKIRKRAAGEADRDTQDSLSVRRDLT
jgi:hypothetical protein